MSRAPLALRARAVSPRRAAASPSRALALAAVRALAVLALLGLAACSRRDPAHLEPARPADLLLVTLDTFRADRAGCLGDPSGLTPTLDRVLRRGSVARNAYAPAPLTAPSHATMLTGKEPPNHGVRENGLFRLDESHATLASHLAAQGFRTAAFIAAFPLESRFGFARGFEKYDETLGPSASSALYYAERPARAVVDSVEAFLPAIPATDRLFLWVHFFDAHHPYAPPRPFALLPGRTPYEREIRALDAQLGRLLRVVAATGRTPVLAILSDHGEGLGDHVELSHGILIHEESMRGLFGLAAPGGAPVSAGGNDGAAVRPPAGLAAIHEPPTSYADLAPTLLEMLDLPPMTDVDGVAWMRAPASRGVYGETYYPMLHYRWSPLLSWRDERWSYIHGPNPQLFDRIADPGETRNLVEAFPAIAAEREALLEEREVMPVPESEALDDEAREKLAALGYVASTPGSFDRSKDPHRLIGSVNALFRGMTLVTEGSPQAALPYLQRAHREDPDNAAAVFHLANCLREIGDVRTAMTYYRKAIDLDRRVGEAWAHLALLRWERGERQVATELLKEGLAENPRSYSLLLASGELALEVGRYAAAESHFRSAAEAEPHRPEPLGYLAGLAERRGDREEARRLRAKAESLTRPAAPSPR